MDAFNQAIAAAARVAADAAGAAMRQYRRGRIYDEPDITGAFVGILNDRLTGDIEGISWEATVVRHGKGRAAEEQRIGADMVIHVTVTTDLESYAKGVLIQAKRFDQDERMSARDLGYLQSQCQKMLGVTPSSFVFDYARSGMRVGSASRVGGTRQRDLYSSCDWTPYRFFRELFRSPIGDPRFTSAAVADLPVPTVVKIAGVEAGVSLRTEG